MAFAFIVKDGEEYLATNVARIQDIGQRFASYRIFFVENDSNDNTRGVLGALMRADPRVEGTFLKLADARPALGMCPRGYLVCPARLQRLAFLRNAVLDLARARRFDGDWLVMLDADFVHMPDPQPLFGRMLARPELSAAFGMSHFRAREGGRMRAYDLLAVRPPSVVPALILAYTRWHAVDSAFSGFGVYRWSAIRNLRYNANTTVCEHLEFNAQLANKTVDACFRPQYALALPTGVPGLSTGEARALLWGCVALVLLALAALLR